MKKTILLCTAFLFVTDVYCDGMGYLAIGYFFQMLRIFFAIVNLSLFLVYHFRRNAKIKYTLIASAVFYLFFLAYWLSMDFRYGLGFSLNTFWDTLRINGWRLKMLYNPILLLVTSIQLIIVLFLRSKKIMNP